MVGPFQSDTATDEALVRRCLAGEAEAQTEFIRRFKPKIFRRMCRLTGSYDLAEDLTQETLVRALTKMALFREAVTLDGWVYRIAGNLVTDYFRSEKIRREKTLEQSYAPVGADAPRGSDEQLITHERRRAVAAAVADLPDIYRDVVMLAHYEDLPLQDIAESLGLGLSAVKMRLQRARGMLLKALEKLYD